MNQQQIDTFIRFALPGMALRRQPAPPPPVKSLVKRCPGTGELSCGRKISENKRICLWCWKLELPNLKARIAEQLAKMEPEQWEKTILGLDAELRPELPPGVSILYDIRTNDYVIRRS